MTQIIYVDDNLVANSRFCSKVGFKYLYTYKYFFITALIPRVISLSVCVVNGEVYTFLLNTDDYGGRFHGLMIYLSKHKSNTPTIYMRVLLCW